MDLREVGYDDRDWINLAQDRDRWRAYVLLQSNYKMVDIMEGEVARAVTLIQQGWTCRQIASDLRFSVSVVYRAVIRYRESGQFERRRGQGRKRKTTGNQDRFLVLSALRRRTSTVSEGRGSTAFQPLYELPRIEHTAIYQFFTNREKHLLGGRPIRRHANIDDNDTYFPCRNITEEGLFLQLRCK
ncbi:hypothetical protein ANN_21705 [Periplaneta americana]|uniref:Paired domain-containing protein n=1 Tax=Periplaneta americana TaxID=6978 RepID=A0ABQ8S678_PERAM|nr:hypothetical protein ANN_21705 [Periplaneta americana]